MLSGVIVTNVLAVFYSCGAGDDKQKIATDSASIANGEIAFTQNCSGCHNFIQDGIGPHLAGLTVNVPAEWISNFIQHPKKMIDEGDERAMALYEKYHSVMPSFENLEGDTLDDIIAYINTFKVPAGKPDYDTTYIRDPIPEKIEMSDLVLTLEEFTQIPFSSDQQPRTRIAKLDAQPSTGKIFVLDIRGKLYLLDGSKPQEYMDMKSLRKDFIDKPGLATGFGSFAFHPAFLKNGLLYTSHTEPAGNGKPDFYYADSIPVAMQWVVTEWKVKDPRAEKFDGDGRELMRINMVTGIHGMQELTFNPLAKKGSRDYGLLYIGIGDCGSVESNYPFLVRNLRMPFGTILRIDPKGNNSANGKYGIPSNNPFARDTAKLREIYAYGFRNPHRITWSTDGKMLASNIGQASIEALNMILPGHDYGWPIREGSFLIYPEGNINKPHPLPDDDTSYKISYPVAQYDHDEGKAICGGFEYAGTNVKQLKSKYVFGDLNNGRLFFVEIKNLKTGSIAPIKEWKPSVNGKITTMKELCGNERVDLRLGRDGNGEIYLMTKPDGKIYRITGVTKRNS